MIVWRGRGILVAIITFGCLLLIELLTRFLSHDNTYYQEHGWPKLAGFLAAASLVYWLSPRKRVDFTCTSEWARRFLFREQDTLFHDSVKYWPRILCMLGVAFYFVRSLH
jgi:hypothetical protein